MKENQVHIPEGWHLKQVQEFALKMRSGGTPKSDNPKFYNGEISFVAIDDLTSANKYLEKTQKHITKQGLNNSTAWLVPVNTIMYSIYATLGVPRINLIEVATNQAILNIIPDEHKITLEFLFYLLLEKRSSILAHSAHTTQSNLNAKIVKELEFVFPKNPLEQSQIANILSKVDEAITQTEKLIVKYNRIKTGLMQDLLTKGIDENGNIRSEETHKFKDSPLGRIPKEWECESLSNGLNHISDYRGKTPPYTDSGIPVISAESIKNGELKKTSKYVTETTYQFWLTREMPEPGDVIFTTEAPVGEIALFPKDKKHLLTRRVIAFNCKKKKLDSQFLYYLLLNFKDKGIWDKYTIGSTVPRILKPDITSQPVVYPSIDEQLKVIKTIALQRERIETETVKFSKYISIKTGLMQDLLSGKVRVTHLIKETASV